MKVIIRLLLGAGMLWPLAGSKISLAEIASLPNGDRYAIDEVIVALDFGAPRLETGNSISGTAVTGNESIDRLCREAGVVLVRPFYTGRLTRPSLIREVSRLYIFILGEGVDAADILPNFRDNRAIESAALNILPELCYIPNDPRYSDQWYLAHIGADDGWDIIRGDSARQSVIGIIDTGVHWDHPDLAPNIWINTAEDVNQNGIFDPPDNDGIDADSNGFVDDVVGWDFGDGDNTPVDDVTPHGTPVAGTASEATDNGLQGAAVGFSARLMAVKVFGSSGMPNNAYQGIVYAAENGAGVINCSWSYGSFSEIDQALITAAWNAGALIVAPAAAQSNNIPNYPAAYEHVMAVAATDRNDRKTSFSSYGTWIDISAPGIDILTTYGQSDFVSYSGTSFASALVSGLAALIRARFPAYTPDETEALIELSSDPIDDINPGYPGQLGAGRINCGNWALTSLDKTPELPAHAALLQNYPNPFNASTTIIYILPEASEATLGVYNILGEKIVTFDISRQERGPHEIIWDAAEATSGIYFYVLTAGPYSVSRRCLLLK